MALVAAIARGAASGGRRQAFARPSPSLDEASGALSHLIVLDLSVDMADDIAVPGAVSSATKVVSATLVKEEAQEDDPDAEV